METHEQAGSPLMMEATPWVLVSNCMAASLSVSRRVRLRGIRCHRYARLGKNGRTFQTTLPENRMACLEAIHSNRPNSTNTLDLGRNPAQPNDKTHHAEMDHLRDTPSIQQKERINRTSKTSWKEKGVLNEQ